MSKKRKNFHYHYAEKFESRSERVAKKRNSRRFAVRPVALFLSLVMLALFGFVSITFSSFVTSSNGANPGIMLVSVRNKAIRSDTTSYGLAQKSDLAQTGADTDLNGTGATSTTVYYAITAGDVGSYTVECNVNRKGDGDDWKQYTMTDTNKTAKVNGDDTVYKVYSVTFTDLYDGLGKLQFQLYDGSTWKSQVEPITSWTSASTYNGKLWKKGGSSWVGSSDWNYIVTYNVTVQSEDTSKGTVASASVQAGSTAVTLPTATPAYGWKFKNWTTTDSSITINSATSASGATVSATAAGTVTANFEKDDSMNLYIAGRFHVQTSDDSNDWTNSFDNGDWSNTGDDNIKFTWDSTAKKYKVETHASLKNLSDSISGYVPWFFVYDKGNSKYWYRTTADTYLTLSNKSTTLTKYDSKDDSQNAKLRFKDQHDDKPVTLFFDPTTGELSYEVPPFFDVTVNGSITHGTVTADTGRTEAGSTVTLTVTPEEGYVIGSVTYNDGTDHTITSSGGGYSFTMPNHDVTVSATFNGVPTITSFLINNNTSATLNVAGTATLYSQTLFDGGNSVNYSVTGDSGVISISGNTVTAVKPGTATITASLQGATESKSVTVTVNAPTASFSGSVEELRSGTISVSSATPNPTSYSWSVKSGSDSLISLGSPTNASSVTVNSLKAKAEGATATVVLTAGYSTGYSTTFEYVVSITDSPISIHGDFTSSWADHKMLYDSTTGKYKITMDLAGSKTFNFDIKDGSSYYKNNTKITESNQSYYAPDTSGLELSQSSATGNDCQIETNAEGRYTFYYDYTVTDNGTKHYLYIDDYPGIEYHILGLDGTWDKSDDTIMTETSAGSGIYTLTKALTYNDVIASTETTGFKVYCNDGNWYAHSSTTFTIDKTSETLVSGDGISNLGLTPWYSGNYTFTFNSNSKLLTITGPTRSITVNAKLNGTDTVLGTVTLANPSNDFFTLAYNGDDTFTVTAKDHSQYTFLNWGSGNTLTSYTITTTASDTTKTLNANWNYRGYDVTFHTNGGTLTGTGIQAITANSEYKSDYTYGTGMTLPTSITHATVPGYTFAGWYEESDFSGSAVTAIGTTETGEKTYYAKWTVDVEFKDNIDETLLYTMQGVTVGSDISSSAPGKTNWSERNTALENMGYEFSGTFDNALTNISGSNPFVVHANYIPKTYSFTITLTPNDKVYDINGDPIVVNNTLVKPEVGKTQENPYVVKFGAAIKAQAELTVPSTLDSKIQYKWYIKDGSTETEVISTKTSDSTSTKYKYTNDNITTMMTQPATGNTGKLFCLYVKAVSKDYQNSDIDSGALVTDYNIYYIVKSPMNTITAVPDQMIYSSAPDLKAGLEVDSSITSDNSTSLTTNYKADLKLFDKSSATYSDLLVNQGIAKNATEFYALFKAVGSDSINGYTQVDASTERGVNNFKATLKRSQGSEYVDDSTTARKEIAVGTNDNMASRPLFVTDLVSGNGLSEKRVTLFYINSRNTLSYLTATSFEHDSTTNKKVYRFDIPANVTTVYVAAFDPNVEYNMPTFDGSTVIWPTSCDYYSDYITISSSTQTIKINSISDKGLTVTTDTF